MRVYRRKSTSQIPLRLGVSQAGGKGRRRILHTFSDITLFLAYCAFRSLYFVLLSQQRAPRYKAVAWRFRTIRFSSHRYRSHLWIAQEERKSLEWCHGLTVFFPFTTDTPFGKCFRAPRLRAACRCAAHRQHPFTCFPPWWA